MLTRIFPVKHRVQGGSDAVHHREVTNQPAELRAIATASAGGINITYGNFASAVLGAVSPSAERRRKALELRRLATDAL